MRAVVLPLVADDPLLLNQSVLASVNLLVKAQ